MTFAGSDEIVATFAPPQRAITAIKNLVRKKIQMRKNAIAALAIAIFMAGAVSALTARRRKPFRPELREKGFNNA